MALDADILLLIRDEIGDDLDFTDSDLETIYNDANRGASNEIKTALVVWRKRLANFQSRAFDVAVSGTLLSRKQRGQFMDKRIKELEFRLPEGDFSAIAANANVDSSFEQEDASTRAELSG